MVFVSHRLDEVIEIAERVTVLRDGKKVGEFPAREMTTMKLTALMTGKPFDETYACDVGAARGGLGRQLTRDGEYEDVNLTCAPARSSG